MTTSNGLSSLNEGRYKPSGLSQCTLSSCTNGNQTDNIKGLKLKENTDHMKGNQQYENLMDYMVDVAKKMGERQSFYVIDLADILRKIQNWKTKLPNVEMFYAIKANSDPVLLRLFVLLGLSFDCATEGEIEIMLNLGASPKNIIWAHTVKTEEGLRYARGVGVDFMTFDSVDELQKIHKVFPSARLLFRIRPSIVECKYDLSEKFGCGDDEALDVLKKAKDLQMKVEGISFHVGALCTYPDAFSQTIRVCADMFQSAETIGFRFSILNLGGGFFGADGTGDIFDQVTQKIRRSLQESFSNLTPVRIIAEPGCYVVGSAMQLVTRIIGKRTVHIAGECCKHYFLNNGIYSSFFKGIEYYGIRVVPLVDKSDLASRPKSKSILFGQTCCSEDVIQKNDCYLPELQVGECIAWENMGAYTNVLCSTFCGVPIPRTVYVFLQSSRDNLEDLMSNKEAKQLLHANASFIKSKNYS